MTVNIMHLCERIASRYPDVEPIDEWVIRFTRKADKQPFAVYYFDTAPDLPETQEELTKYQDRVIGSHYFENRKSLQWNNYLYFITSRDRLADVRFIEIKDLIERDRTYARKFVIAEEEIDSVINPPVIQPAQGSPHEGILSIWTQKLTDAGIDRAILSDDDLPTRLNLIKNSSINTKTKLTQKKSYSYVNNHNEPFICSLSLNKYRNFPIRRCFEFGKVNLIFGVNGTGKTSLLEAIELFYCGRTKRNHNSIHPYDLTVSLADGRSETANNNRDLQLFRDRNLIWYGQPEIRTNNLYQSFSQFNFLNTDAAVDLIDSSERIEEDLSKLLVGPEPSEVWRNIERVSDEISKKLSALNPLKAQIEAEISSLDKQLKAFSEVPEESDSIYARLNEMVSRLGWDEFDSKNEDFSARLVATLSELISLTQQAMQLNWITSPITKEGLAIYCHNAKFVSNKMEISFEKFDQLKREENRLIDVLNDDQKALALMNDITQFVKVDLVNRITEHREQQTIVGKLSSLLSGLDSNIFKNLLKCDLTKLVLDFHQAATSERLNAETLLANVKIEYGNYRKLKDESLNLAQQLREIAAKILHVSSKPDECPLCHTMFEKGGLAKHIIQGVDGDIELLGQTLLSRIREHEAAVCNAKAIEAAAGWILKFAEQANLAKQNLSINSVILEVENINKSLEDAQTKLDLLDREILTLEQQGFSVKKLEEITCHLDALGYRLKTFSEEEIIQLISVLEKNKESSLQALAACKKEIEGHKRIIGEALGTNDKTDNSLKSGLSRLRERIAKTESIRTKLSHLSSLFPWPDELPLAELSVEAESIRKVASDLQTAIVKEKKSKIAFTESTQRKNNLKQEMEDLCPQIDRFTIARTTLEELRREHSLRNAMESVLQENRSSIETIFSQIHSPAEFSGLGKNWITLKRKSDKKEAKLTEISTGQRAAFALSIFLAQNAQLRTAPPVILVDDPIAHIDDMNALAFLDYLREVVLRGQRQIFFATANDKLAALFERKFDFLGQDDFRRFNLTRHA
jgi:exonuclease SbcC